MFKEITDVFNWLNNVRVFAFLLVLIPAVYKLADLNTHLKTHDEELGSHSVRITRLEDHVGIKGDNDHE